MEAAGSQGSRELGAIVPLAALDLREVRDEMPGAAVQVSKDGRALRLEAEARPTLPSGRNPIIGDEVAAALHG
jgi:hypothetical protein